MGEPYLLVSADGPGFRTNGVTACRLGHEIPKPGGGRPDGVFAGWSWDGTTLRADTDRYGMHPLYYFSTRERFAISPSLPTLLGFGPAMELDESALAVFLRLGYFLGEDTPFLSIRALPPQGTIEWSASGLEVSRRQPEPRLQELGRDAAMDGYIELFRTAMLRRVRADEDVAVPLSGGRDSRHILLELCRAGRRPKFCVTMRHFPPMSNEDTTVATIVARRTGVPHVILPQEGSWIDAEIRKNVITNFCADEHAWLLPVADYLRGRVRSIYDGIGGDVMSAGLFLSPERLRRFESRQFAELAGELLRRAEGRIHDLLAPEWADRLGLDRAVARLTTELARHAGAPNPVGSFFFWNRTRREIALASYRILDGGLEVLSPYLDHDLFDFLASLPAPLVMDGQFHTDTIRRAYPEYGDIRFEEKNRESWRSGWHFRRRAAQLAGMARRCQHTGGTSRIADDGVVLRRARGGMVLGSTPGLDWRMTVFAVYLMQLAGQVSPDGSPSTVS